MKQILGRRRLFLALGRRNEDAVGAVLVLVEEDFHHDDVAGRERLARGLSLLPVAGRRRRREAGNLFAVIHFVVASRQIRRG